MRHLIFLSILIAACGGDGQVPASSPNPTSIWFTAERRASFKEVIPLARHDSVRGLPGTRIWSDIVFTTDEGEYLLQIFGNTHIKHLQIPHPNGTEYGIYANCRVGIFMAPKQSMLPPVGTVPPEDNVLTLNGGNISHPVLHKYLNSVNYAQVRVPAHTAVRPELWCASGTDAWDIDGLGGLGNFNPGIIHQFNVIVWRR